MPAGRKRGRRRSASGRADITPDCRPAPAQSVPGVRCNARTPVRRLARSLAVHGVEEVAVLLLDDPALELETRRELPCLDGQVRWQDREVLDRLPPRQPLVELLDVACEQFPHL